MKEYYLSTLKWLFREKYKGNAMSVIRVEHQKNFVVIQNNTVLQDPNLSWKAKGIWSYAMTRPDEWEFHVSHLATISGDGKSSIYAGLKELERAGYLRKVQKRVEGKFVKVDYVISEIKIILPLTEKPHAENRTLVSIDNTNTSSYEEVISPIVPKKEEKKKTKVAKIKEEKREVAERVNITASQEESLLKKASGDVKLVKTWFQKLSDWKIGKEIFSCSNDYRSIINWVIASVEQSGPAPHKVNREDNFLIIKEIEIRFKKEALKGQIGIGYDYIEFPYCPERPKIRVVDHGFREQVLKNLRHMNLDVRGI